MNTLNSSLKRAIPLRFRRLLSRWATRSTRWPPVGTVQLGSLDRVSPISSKWGFDRGLPIDRYYINQFLEGQAQRIRGRVLEIDTNDYTRRFGEDRVERSDVLHISEMRPGVTLVGDLTSADHLPSNAFDCVILTQTLQLVYDVSAAIRTVHRILKPGGTALVTVPGLTKMTDGAWGYFWLFTTLSGDRLFRECFPGGEIEVRGWGNVLAATAFLHGLATEELEERSLDHEDPDFAVLISIRAVKGNGS
jgi:SAM-dependent methyltransferase